MPTVFVSATTKALKSFRLAAAEKLKALGHTVVVQDEFPMVHTKIAQMLANQIAPCDAVILLIGPVFGAKPADWPDRSVKGVRLQNRRRDPVGHRTTGLHRPGAGRFVSIG